LFRCTGGLILGSKDEKQARAAKKGERKERGTIVRDDSVEVKILISL
jgi:hypothetical protein